MSTTSLTGRTFRITSHDYTLRPEATAWKSAFVPGSPHLLYWQELKNTAGTFRVWTLTIAPCSRAIHSGVSDAEIRWEMQEFDNYSHRSMRCYSWTETIPTREHCQT